MINTSTLFYLLDSREESKHASELHQLNEFDDVLDKLGEPIKAPEKAMEPINELIRSLAIE